MTLAAWMASAAFGVVGGFLAGLVGVGGGVVLVPFLYLLLEHPAWSGVTVPGDRITLVAHATSLAVIVPTSASALLAFSRARLVAWRTVITLGIGAAFGAAITTRMAPAVPDRVLRVGFALFLVGVGLHLAWGRPVTAGPAEGAGATRPGLAVAGGVGIGVFSALLGVGGGLVAIPVLIWGFRLDLTRVAAASIGVVAFASVAATAGYLSATPPADLAGVTVGWVLAPAALALAPGAVVGARWGTRINRRLKADVLRRLFAVVLLVLGGRLGWGAATAGTGGAGEGPVDPSPRPAAAASLR